MLYRTMLLLEHFWNDLKTFNFNAQNFSLSRFMTALPEMTITALPALTSVEQT